MEPFTRVRGPFEISTDPARIDAVAVHAALERMYWCEGIPFETVRTALAHSLCFGLYHGQQQIGLARFVTDHATYAYLCDVYVLEAFRGQGLGKWLIGSAMEHPLMAGCRRLSLVTRDAHSLYRGVGFTALSHPERYMEILQPGIYKR